MAEPGLWISTSRLSRGTAGRAHNPQVLARLQALDKNGDGQLDLDEVCDAIDEIVRKEKTERTLKWLLAALAVFSLLTIAATVGLTYAVVALSKDTKVEGSVLKSKDTGEVLRTGSFLSSQNVTMLHDAVAASDEPGAVLARIKSIKVPSLKEGEAYTVYKVDSITMMANQSMLVRTSTGMDVLMPVEGLMPNETARQRPIPLPSMNDSTTVQDQGRKLLQTYHASVMVYQGYDPDIAAKYYYEPAEFRYYLCDFYDPADTIADVKACIASGGWNKEVNSPPVDMLKIAYGLGGPIADATKIANLQYGDGPSNARQYELWVGTRRVNVNIAGADIYDYLPVYNLFSGSDRRPMGPVRTGIVFPPVDETFAGFKREFSYRYHVPDGYFVTISLHNDPDTMLFDDDKISTYCPLPDASFKSGAIVEGPDCTIDVRLIPLPVIHYA